MSSRSIDWTFHPKRQVAIRDHLKWSESKSEKGKVDPSIEAVARPHTRCRRASRPYSTLARSLSAAPADEVAANAQGPADRPPLVHDPQVRPWLPNTGRDADPYPAASRGLRSELTIDYRQGLRRMSRQRRTRMPRDFAALGQVELDAAGVCARIDIVRLPHPSTKSGTET